MKRVICSYFLGLYSSAYLSRLAGRRQNCLPVCLALNRQADYLDLNCFPDSFSLDCPANWLDLNCLYLNYFADCFALNGRALVYHALYFPAQTRRARNQAIFYQQDNLRLEPVKENFYFISRTDLLMQSISGWSRPGLRASTPFVGGLRCVTWTVLGCPTFIEPLRSA